LAVPETLVELTDTCETTVTEGVVLAKLPEPNMLNNRGGGKGMATIADTCKITFKFKTQRPNDHCEQ
jgi:hypothetical protein